MDTDALHEVMASFIKILTLIWIVFLFPSFLLIKLALGAHLEFLHDGALLEQILYYNMMFFPFVLLVSIGFSWLFLKHKQYWLSIGFSLLPLLTFFIELVAADISLILS